MRRRRTNNTNQKPNRRDRHTLIPAFDPKELATERSNKGSDPHYVFVVDVGLLRSPRLFMIFDHFSQKFLLLPLVLIANIAVGCAQRHPDDAYPREVVADADWHIALATIREGDSLHPSKVLFV